MDIHFEAVTFAYNPDVIALRGINLDIAAGESLAIIGENGAGKTTLVKQLNGLLKPASGRVRVGDWNTQDHSVSQLAQRVGYAFQNPDDQLFKRSVAAEVAFGPKNLSFSEAETADCVDWALDLVGLSAERETHPHDLHSSQRRLVSLAATLAMQTPVLVFDEPTIGQDAVGLERLRHIIRVLQAKGRTVIAISHNIDFCAENFARVVLMSRGQIQADGATAQVLSQQTLLNAAQVESPQMTRLARALGLASAPLTVEEFTAVFAQSKEN